MQNDTWLYKNYKPRMDESQYNGIIVAFDPTRENAILHQQVLALQEKTNHDCRVVGTYDTPAALLRSVKYAFDEGYEHLTVLTSAGRISEVDRFLRTKCGTLFESITVVPEHSPRLYEQDEVGGELDDLLAGNPQQSQPQQAQPQQAGGEPTTLLMFRANPPTKGFGKYLEGVLQAVAKQKAPNPHIVLHNTNLQQPIITLGVRRTLFNSSSENAAVMHFYAKNGVRPINDPAKVLEREIFVLRGQPLKALQQHPTLSKADIQKIFVPQDSLAVMQQQLPNFPIEAIRGPAVDVDSKDHSRVISIGEKIANDCPKKEEKKEAPATEEPEEKSEDQKQQQESWSRLHEAEPEEGGDTEVPDIDMTDTATLYMIEVCIKGTGDEKQALASLQATWKGLKLAQEDLALLKQVGEDTGIGDAIDVVKNIGKAAGSPGAKVKKKDPKVEKAEEAMKTVLDSLSFDFRKALKHSQYPDFKKQIDLP